nr:MAG TPA: hypothetical protein [Caudoviricetes sp.]
MIYFQTFLVDKSIQTMYYVKYRKEAMQYVGV